MPYAVQGDTGAERSDQERLADQLIVHLGPEGAAHACQGNAWYGVLHYVLAQSAPNGNSER